MSKRSQEASSSEFSPMAKPKPMIPAKLKPMNLVLHNRLSARKNPPQDLRDPVNPGMPKRRRGRGGEKRFSVCVCALCAVCDLFRHSSEIGQNQM